MTSIQSTQICCSLIITRLSNTLQYQTSFPITSNRKLDIVKEILENKFLQGKLELTLGINGGKSYLLFEYLHYYPNLVSNLIKPFSKKLGCQQEVGQARCLISPYIPRNLERVSSNKPQYAYKSWINKNTTNLINYP